MPPGLDAMRTALRATSLDGIGFDGGFGAGAGCANRLIGRERTMHVTSQKN